MCVCMCECCNLQSYFAGSDLLAVHMLLFCEKEMSSFRQKKSAYLDPVPGPRSTHEIKKTKNKKQKQQRGLSPAACNAKANIVLLNIVLSTVHIHACCANHTFDFWVCFLSVNHKQSAVS